VIAPPGRATAASHALRSLTSTNLLRKSTIDIMIVILMIMTSTCERSGVMERMGRAEGRWGLWFLRGS
jgi:hypothetical protein